VRRRSGGTKVGQNKGKLSKAKQSGAVKWDQVLFKRDVNVNILKIREPTKYLKLIIHNI